MYPIRTRTAYRRGEQFSFEPPPAEDWEMVTLELAPGARVEWSATGVRLIYRGDIPFGVEIQAALQLGWCALVEKPAGECGA